MKHKANIELFFIFKEKDPVGGISVELGGMRTHCIRPDMPKNAEGDLLSGIAERPCVAF